MKHTLPNDFSINSRDSTALEQNLYNPNISFNPNQYECSIFKDTNKLGTVKYEGTFKLILIGSSGVGKSCIIKRIGSNTFSSEHEVTIGAEFTTIAAQINKKTFIKLQFWDSCGQERFNSVTRIFYRGSQCVLLVYEVSKYDNVC